MDLGVWIVIGIIIFTIIAFSFELLRNDLVALSAMSMLILFGVLTPEEATRGFSSSATLTVACMFIISAAFVNAGLVELVSRYLSRWKEPRSGVAILLLMLLVGFISVFINNTATVAVFIPIAVKVAQLTKSSRKQYLIPLSYAAIFGGTCTLIGTSTNIIVNSIYLEHGFSGFKVFEFASLGLILSALGIFYMMTIGRKLLRNKEELDAVESAYQYLTEVELESNSPSTHKRLLDSPIYKDFKQNIVHLKRGAQTLSSDEDPLLCEGDRFLLLCSAEKIRSLRNQVGILILDRKFGPDDMPEGMEIREVVVPVNSELVGQPLVQSEMVRSRRIIPLAVRHRLDALFTFLHRARIYSGDVLIVAAQSEVFEEFRKDEHLILLTHPKTNKVNWLKLSVSFLLIVLLVTSATFGIVRILPGAIFVCCLLVLSKTISLKEAYESLDAQVLVLLSCILSLGLALEKSGGVAFLSDMLLTHAGAYGPFFVISALYLLTSLLTEVMSNNATAVLMAPIALSIAATMGLDEKPFLIAVMFAGSASFMTPAGYQTNALIFAPGGYRVADFLRVGTPLNILFWIAATFLIPIFFPFS